MKMAPLTIEVAQALDTLDPEVVEPAGSGAADHRADELREQLRRELEQDHGTIEGEAREVPTTNGSGPGTAAAQAPAEEAAASARARPMRPSRGAQRPPRTLRPRPLLSPSSRGRPRSPRAWARSSRPSRSAASNGLIWPRGRACSRRITPQPMSTRTRAAPAGASPEEAHDERRPAHDPPAPQRGGAARPAGVRGRVLHEQRGGGRGPPPDRTPPGTARVPGRICGIAYLLDHSEPPAPDKRCNWGKARLVQVGPRPHGQL